MSIANDALLQGLGQGTLPVHDGRVATGTTQGTATRLSGRVNRFTLVASGGAAVLPSLLTNEAAAVNFVINDGVNALNVFPFTGETRNGTLNSALSVPVGQSAVFIKVTATQIAKGGGVAPGSIANDWRSAVIP